jgi:hypothetical protein
MYPFTWVARDERVFVIPVTADALVAYRVGSYPAEGVPTVLVEIDRTDDGQTVLLNRVHYDVGDDFPVFLGLFDEAAESDGDEFVSVKE